MWSQSTCSPGAPDSTPLHPVASMGTLALHPIWPQPWFTLLMLAGIFHSPHPLALKSSPGPSGLIPLLRLLPGTCLPPPPPTRLAPQHCRPRLWSVHSWTLSTHTGLPC